jgi:hypothetical protein
MSNKDQKILVNLDIYGDEIVRGNETVTGVVSANALITQHLTSYNYSFIQTLSVNSVSGIYYGDGYNITNINSNNITGVIPITAGGTGSSNIDWMTLVRGYNTTPTLLASLINGDVYSYIYTSSPSDITYYRYIATDGSEDKFYSYFSGNTLSGLIASKSIFI